MCRMCLLSMGLLLFVLTTVFAQNHCPDLPLVTVVGRAAVQAVPNRAIVTVQVEKQIAIASLNSISDAFLFAKEDIDIRVVDEKNLRHTLPELQVGNGSVVLVKYFVVTLTDLSTLQKLMVELVKKGFTQIESVRYRVDNLEALKAQADKAALEQASVKANLYAAEIGQAIGSVHRIVELEGTAVNWYDKEMKRSPAELSNEVYIVSPGFLTVSSNLQVSFDLLKQP
jgi:uncharacterized protein YggE